MENKPRETKSAGGVVLNRAGEILVVSQHGTSWSLPKGHIEEGEDAITAAKREIYEESGIVDLQLIKELGSYQRYRIDENGGEDQSEMKTIIMFLFTTGTNVLKPIDSENPEARWIHKKKGADVFIRKKKKNIFINF